MYIAVCLILMSFFLPDALSLFTFFSLGHYFSIHELQRVHSWHCKFYGFWQVYNGMYPPLYHREQFNVLEILSSVYPSHPFLNPWQQVIFPPYFYSFACCIVLHCWNHKMCSLSKSAFLNLLICFCMSFQDSIAHFFLPLNNIPLSECTTFCLLIC